MTAKHAHVYTVGRSGKVATCPCGAFQHVNPKPEDIIAEITVPYEEDRPDLRGGADGRDRDWGRLWNPAGKAIRPVSD